MFSDTLKGFREALGVHTCDQRRTKTFIRGFVGDIMNIEPGFTEEDELWTADHRETNPEMDIRLHAALDQVFNRDGICWSLRASRCRAES